MMEYNFMWSTPKSGAPIVSIASYGITFNSASIELLKKPSKVLIGYDIKRNVIGVKPVDIEVEDDIKSFAFAERERNGYIRIGNKDFVTYIASKVKLDISKSQRFPAEWVEESQLLIVDLNTPMDGFDRDTDESDESHEK